MRTRFGFLAVLMLLALCAARAQSVHFGPQLGIFNATNADESRLMAGLALRLRFSRAFGLEGSVNYRQEDYSDGYVTVRSWPVMVTALLYPVPDIYGAIGLGWYNSSIDYRAGYPGVVYYTSSETRQDFGWHLGGGVDLPLSRATHLVGDVRYVFLDYGFREPSGATPLNNNFYVVMVGLQFRL